MSHIVKIQTQVRDEAAVIAPAVQSSGAVGKPAPSAEFRFNSADL